MCNYVFKAATEVEVKEAFLEGAEVYSIFKQLGATHLHHANSVITSCTFLEQHGLLSRGFIQKHRLKQSPQPWDELDKKYGIWHSIFLPHVDNHDHAGRTRGPNQYGPVLFIFDLDILLRLPASTQIRVTRRSPVYWYDTEAESGRWFQTAEDLAKSISPADTEKMIAIQTPSEELEFPDRRTRIILDDPQRQLASGEDAYTCAESRLRAAAAAGGTEVSIEKRRCQSSCLCGEKYAAWSVPVLDFYFS